MYWMRYRTSWIVIATIISFDVEPKRFINTLTCKIDKFWYFLCRHAHKVMLKWIHQIVFVDQTKQSIHITKTCYSTGATQAPISISPYNSTSSIRINALSSPWTIPSYQCFGYISTQHICLIVDYYSYCVPTLVHESLISSHRLLLYSCTIVRTQIVLQHFSVRSRAAEWRRGSALGP